MSKSRHIIKVNVSDCKGNKRNVLSGTTLRMPQRLMRFLFGEFAEILVLNPGASVEGIEIKEVKDGGGYIEEDR